MRLRTPRHRDNRLLARPIGIGRIVENRIDSKIVSLRERIVFVIMTLAATDRCAHPRTHRCIHPIDNRCRAKLLIDRAPFAIGQRVAMESCCDFIVEGCTGE